MLLATDVMTQTSNRAARAEVAALVTGLRAGGEEAWNAPTACPGWAAKDVVVHLLDNHGLAYKRVRAATEGRPPPDFDPTQRKAGLIRMLARPREALLADLERLINDFGDYTDGLDAATVARPITMPFSTVPLYWLANIALAELVLHHYDVRAPRDPDARLTAEAVPLLVPLLISAMILLAVGEKTNGVWQFDIDRPATPPVTLHVQDNSVSYERLAATSPDARLELDGDAFVRLLWGRFDLATAIDRGRVRVDGDHDRALALQRLYRGV